MSMDAAPLRPNDSGMEEGNVAQMAGLRLLKSKAIYGGNASGKSNLAKAFSAFTVMVSRSVAEEGISRQIWNDRFQLITDWDDQPIFFQYIFLVKNKIYRYGFQIVKGRVTYEWLYSGVKKEEREYFMRSPEGLKVNENYIKGYTEFVKRGVDGTNELFRPDSLFLTAAALNGHKLLGDIRNNIRSIMAVDGMDDANASNYAMRHLIQGAGTKRNAIKRFLSLADTGIEDLETRELPEHLIDKSFIKEMTKDGDKAMGLYSLHSRYDEYGIFVDKVPVPFGEWESEGTGKLFGVGTLILDALSDGRVIIIDEFDARFHPNLTLKLVELFNKAESNPRNAQLIFITHDAGLLRRAELRRDQICLVDKDKYGISKLTNLIEFKGVRKDASYEKEYLNGSYSAVPFLAEMDWVLMEKNPDDLSKTK